MRLFLLPVGWVAVVKNWPFYINNCEYNYKHNYIHITINITIIITINTTITSTTTKEYSYSCNSQIHTHTYIYIYMAGPFAYVSVSFVRPLHPLETIEMDLFLHGSQFSHVYFRATHSTNSEQSKIMSAIGYLQYLQTLLPPRSGSPPPHPI